MVGSNLDFEADVLDSEGLTILFRVFEGASIHVSSSFEMSGLFFAGFWGEEIEIRRLAPGQLATGKIQQETNSKFRGLVFLYSAAFSGVAFSVATRPSLNSTFVSIDSFMSAL